MPEELEESADKKCVGCFFESLAAGDPERVKDYPQFPHTCGRSDPISEQELERVNRTAEEVLRKEKEKMYEADRNRLEQKADKKYEHSAKERLARTEDEETKSSDSTFAKGDFTCIEEAQHDPFRRQVGGDHYLGFEIQPGYFCIVNKIPAAETHIIKYVCRWRNKGGLLDLKKAQHWLDMLIVCEEDRDKS